MAKLKDAQSVLGPWQEWGPPPMVTALLGQLSTGGRGCCSLCCMSWSCMGRGAELRGWHSWMWVNSASSATAPSPPQREHRAPPEAGSGCPRERRGEKARLLLFPRPQLH